LRSRKSAKSPTSRDGFAEDCLLGGESANHRFLDGERSKLQADCEPRDRGIARGGILPVAPSGPRSSSLGRRPHLHPTGMRQLSRQCWICFRLKGSSISNHRLPATVDRMWTVLRFSSWTSRSRSIASAISASRTCSTHRLNARVGGVRPDAVGNAWSVPQSTNGPAICCLLNDAILTVPVQGSTQPTY